MFMADITIVNGVYKPTYNWGAPSCTTWSFFRDGVMAAMADLADDLGFHSLFRAQVYRFPVLYGRSATPFKDRKKGRWVAEICARHQELWWIYHLVMTNSLPWKITIFNR